MARLPTSRVHNRTPVGGGAALFTMLLQHSGVHFRAEEQHMEDIGYAGLETHKGEHQAMKKELEGLYVKIRAGGPTSMRELVSFLNGWWLRHIIEDDTKYKA